MTKEEIKVREKELLKLTNTFCIQKLDAEYSELCEKLILKMGRKREVPFKSGKIEIWAAAVVHALGSINFLFDRSSEPYLSADDICEYFGTKKSTVSNKARQIRDMFKMAYFDPEFSTADRIENNPYRDLVMVDGLIVSLSMLPEHLQELVRKEREAGRDVEFTSEPE
ncbi:MAG: DUF6398 domain-containing protein [Dysgonamonadaceae bacterium]|jgi:hypothetical protein|nr:DUF6398 domain-containing protein [Dysgonamonadaceae bacterium]MDD3355438.1 DUF6398 domain-containing protein [Dysgonamonadaceae bacterium]MDD3727425.1 DUF6398 domain-containing protein [Dysgonamonadaceae bacterium]MDD4245532.1 DUF6398 domain-containing protein [Dysgonamonadaceae bacterium]MDD4604801.1 DUF6398 domain-containing protein [Dysgonamonadaceae bacterium]